MAEKWNDGTFGGYTVPSLSRETTSVVTSMDHRITASTRSTFNSNLKSRCSLERKCHWLLNHDHVYFTPVGLTLHENAISCQVKNAPDVGPSDRNIFSRNFLTWTLQYYPVRLKSLNRTANTIGSKIKFEPRTERRRCHLPPLASYVNVWYPAPHESICWIPLR